MVSFFSKHITDALVAQSVEQLPFKEMVEGSIPSERTFKNKKVKTAPFSAVF